MNSIFCIVILALASSIDSISGQSACQLGCPEGWHRLGFSEDCYRLPSQPAPLDTFWNHDKRCKELDASAHIMVVNTVNEQAIASALALDYAGNWSGNSLWLGGYSTASKWELLDGTNAIKNVLLVGSNLLGSLKNGTCLSADPKTVGLWKVKPCGDKTGIAVCEMPQKNICGKIGQILPVVPNAFDPCSMLKVFPDIFSVPYLVAVLAEIGEVKIRITEYLDGIDAKVCNATKPACEPGCPRGWFSFSSSPNDRCYWYDPSAPEGTFWDMQARCKKLHPTAHITMINNFLEQALHMALIKKIADRHPAFRNVSKLWLGGYLNEKSWEFVDGSYGDYIFAAINGPIAAVNDSCLVADAGSYLGNWRAESCSNSKAAFICEMPKSSECSTLGGTIERDVVPAYLTPETLKPLFTNMPEVQGLSHALGTKKLDFSFDPWLASQNNITGSKYGDAVSSIYCVKASNGTAEPIRSQLNILGETYITIGQWFEKKCKSGSIDAFKLNGRTYLDALARCLAQGYELAMPRHGKLDLWAPFQIDGVLTEYYRKEADGYKKIGVNHDGQC